MSISLFCSDVKEFPEVVIILASFNGEKFLLDQIRSTEVFSDNNCQLLIRDDGSFDASSELIKMLSVQYQNIEFVEDRNGNLGAAESFFLLLGRAYESGATFIMLADQDDEWLPGKKNIQLDLMRTFERNHPNCPLLIHSDLEVVDNSLKLISPSLMEYNQIEHEYFDPLKVLLAQNFVTGCTVVVNKALLDVALPVPKEAVMHDWWLALCAASFGKIEYIDKPLVKYRQHASNEVGARNFRSFLNPFKVSLLASWLKGRSNLEKSVHQAHALADRIKRHDPGNRNLELIEAYSKLLDETPIGRLMKLKALGIHAQSNLRHLLLVSRLFFCRKSTDVYD